MWGVFAPSVAATLLVRERFDLVARGVDDREREHGAGGGADRVRVPRIGSRIADEQCVGAGSVGRARHRAEVAGLLDPDGDEDQGAVLRERALRYLDNGEDAFGLVAIGHLAEDALVHLFRVRVVPFDERRCKVGRANREPGVASARHLANSLGNKEPTAPPLARLPKPEHLLHARILERCDHGQGESSRDWCQAPSRNSAKSGTDLP